MEFGIPKEVRDLEMRMGLTPASVLALVRAGHIVYVERDAGAGAGFRDEDFRLAGVQIVYSAAEAYGRADVGVKVTRPTDQEHSLFRCEQTIFSLRLTPIIAGQLLMSTPPHPQVPLGERGSKGRLVSGNGGGWGILLKRTHQHHSSEIPRRAGVPVISRGNRYGNCR